MILYLIAGIFLLIILIIAQNYFKKIEPKKKKLFYIIIGVIFLIFLFYRLGFGLFSLIFGLIAGAFSFLLRIENLFSYYMLFKNMFNKKSNLKNKSTVNMDLEEARNILGVTENASKAEIKEAYKKMMKKNHPDHGGSKYLANKINQAKDLLL